MADGYEVIPPEEIEAENYFQKGKALRDNNDQEGGNAELTKALNIFRNCHSSHAQARVREIEQLLN